MSDSLLFSFLPYAAVVTAVAGTVHRLTVREPTRAPREPWTPAGRAVLAGGVTVALNHLLGLAAPKAMQAFSASPARLFTLEAVSLIGGLLLGWGLLSLTLRRAREGQWLQAGFLGLLVAQVLTGLHIAVALRWASVWYLHLAVPYLRSVLAFQPDATLLAQAPLVFQVHILCGFVLLALAPFARARKVARVALVPPASEPNLLATPREETAR
ncbi:respiratory nitrate reductase subunit gamma [Pyxidicoccus parkwayensis]|uniref:Respiratory nitrate reductase subunit gamma n=1 Tax=Pyxidicoccus parkwayensis TaxID=2813578 RepID=A0ABX7P2K2_9BACT|nr:respiratory nitrate reductase subunit gamma [Pyxidicoccus parkwaysis]QSQ24098.1 respiratory nitrate reductase subunit gamma [Pyxidicoccus parkwaysis]